MFESPAAAVVWLLLALAATSTKGTWSNLNFFLQNKFPSNNHHHLSTKLLMLSFFLMDLFFPFSFLLLLLLLLYACMHAVSAQTAATTCAGGNGASIPVGYTLQSDGKYYAVKNILFDNHFAAVKACLDEGAQLAKFTTQEEQNIITSLAGNTRRGRNTFKVVVAVVVVVVVSSATFSLHWTSR